MGGKNGDPTSRKCRGKKSSRGVNHRMVEELQKKVEGRRKTEALKAESDCLVKMGIKLLENGVIWVSSK